MRYLSAALLALVVAALSAGPASADDPWKGKVDCYRNEGSPWKWLYPDDHKWGDRTIAKIFPGGGPVATLRVCVDQRESPKRVGVHVQGRASIGCTLSTTVEIYAKGSRRTTFDVGPRIANADGGVPCRAGTSSTGIAGYFANFYEGSDWGDKACYCLDLAPNGKSYPVEKGSTVIVRPKLLIADPYTTPMRTWLVRPEQEFRITIR